MQGFHPGKQKPKNYANGGIVKGPGTGTSDDVPAMVPKDGYIMPADSTQALGFKPGMRQVQLSNGEAVLNGDQVQQAGGFQALDQMKAATHTPVPEQGAEGPKFFFANGGPLDDELRKNSFGDAAATGPGVTRVPTGQPRPSASAASQIPNSAPAGWTGGQGERVTGTDFTRNVSNTMNALAPVAGAAAPIAAGVARGFAGGAKAASASPVLEKTLAYGTPALGFGALASASGSDRAPAAQAPIGTPAASAAPAMRQAVSQMPAEPDTPAAMASAQNPGSQPQALGFAPGVYKHGRGQYSDNPEGMGFKPGFTGKPTAQNDAAAQALADSSMRGFQPAGVEPPAPAASQNLTPADTGQGYGFGLLNSNRIAARNAAMDVQQLKPGSGKVLAGLLQQQADAPNQQIQREQIAQRSQESLADRGLRREEIAQRGFQSASERALKAQELSDNMKTNDVKRQAAGVELTGAQRLQALQGEYLNAETEAARTSAAKKLQALSGKGAQADEYMAVSAGQSVDPATGLAVRAPDLIVNKRTGLPVQGQQGAQQAQTQGPAKITPDAAGKSAFDALPKGARYVGPDGRTYTKN